MMEQVWVDILERFGEDVTLHKKEVDIPLKALIQPCLKREREQERPGPLGIGRRDYFLYMGPAQVDIPLDTVVEWRGKEYRVEHAHLVGERVCPHWWAALYPREEAAV